MAEREGQDVMGVQRRGSILLAGRIWRDFLEEWVLDVGLEGWGEFSRQSLGSQQRE